jgi:hypothetical protein
MKLEKALEIKVGAGGGQPLTNIQPSAVVNQPQRAKRSLYVWETTPILISISFRHQHPANPPTESPPESPTATGRPAGRVCQHGAAPDQGAGGGPEGAAAAAQVDLSHQNLIELIPALL